MKPIKEKDPLAVKRGRNSRAKGGKNERATVHLLEDPFPPPRWLVERRLQSRGGKGEPDVKVSRADSPVVIVGIQCKCGYRPSVRAALEQADIDHRGALSLVFIHDDSEMPGESANEFFACRVSDMLQLLRLYARDHNAILPVDTLPTNEYEPGFKCGCCEGRKP